MFFKKQMFSLTITAHIGTEILVREGRLHRYNERKNQGSKKSEKKDWKKTQHYIVNILDSFLEEKKRGGKRLCWRYM